MKKVLLLAAVLSLSFLNFSCDDDETPASPIGQWKLDSATDVAYLEVKEATFISYDYMGDAFDEGEDCYDIFSLPYTISGDNIIAAGFALKFSVSGDKLSLTTFGETETFTKTTFNTATFSAKACATAKAVKKQGLLKSFSSVESN